MPPQGPRARARLHDWIDARSLALCQATVEKLRADPRLLAGVHARLDRWEASARARGDGRALQVFAEWREILQTSTFEDLLHFVGEDTSDRATRLRQSRPFIGLLTPEERHAILQRFEAL